MSTIRLYPKDGTNHTEAVTPAWSSLWSAIERPARIGTMSTVRTITGENAGTAGFYKGSRGLTRYVTPPNVLPPGPVVGTLSAANLTAGSYFFAPGTAGEAWVTVRVVSGDGLTFRGTLATLKRSVTSGSRTWHQSGEITPGVIFQLGDRLAIEWGGWMNTAGDGRVYFEYGIVSGTPQPDAPAVHGQTYTSANYLPWVQIDTPEPPQPPTGLALTSATSTSLAVAWTAPATGPAATGYEYRLDGGAPVAIGLTTSTTIEGLAPSTPYLVEVRALAGALASTWAPLIASTTAAARPAPGIASQAILSRAGLNPSPEGPDAPAQQWWDIDIVDAEHYNPARSAGLLSYAIGYGSRDPLGRTGAIGVSVNVVVPVGESIEIGHRFRLRLSPSLVEALDLPPGAAVRATAIVTDAQADPVRSWALPGHGEAILWAVTATGWLSRYGAANVDGTAWPVEPVGARIRRILDSLDLTGDVDPTGPDVRPMGTAGSHHQALAAATDSTLGRLVEQPTGRVDYHDPGDRRGRLPFLSLDASQILGDAFLWRQSVADVVNSAEITYGTGDKVTITDPASADPRSGVGPYPAAISTMLDGEVDAYSLATDLVGRRAWPFFQLPAVAIDLARSGLDLDRLGAAFSISVGDRVAMSSMPPGSPWEEIPRGCFVEGYTETATAYAWRLSLVVSDPAMSGVSLRYVDVTPGITYADVDPALSYLDASRIEDPADLL